MDHGELLFESDSCPSFRFSKIYKPPSVFQILKSVSFTATSGELHAIVGVPDSGKTTLLEALTSGAGGDIGGIVMLDKFMLTRKS